MEMEHWCFEYFDKKDANIRNAASSICEVLKK